MRAGLPAGLDHRGQDRQPVTTAAPTTSASRTGPTGQRLLLSIMTRSQANDPEAPTMQPLIADVTTLVVPYLTQPQ